MKIANAISQTRTLQLVKSIPGHNSLIWVRKEDKLAVSCRKVKSQRAEALMPGFDLGKKVGQKMALQKFRRPVILCVVDMADFDGSLPRAALLSLLPK